MTRIRSVLRALLVLSCTVAYVDTAHAQQWTSEQQDVWKNVEAYWAGQKRDVEAFLVYVAPEYQGWSYDDGAPYGRDDVQNWIGATWKTSQELAHAIKPLSIIIQGDVAVVHYVYSVIDKTADGKQEFSSGRWTDILKRKSDKWIMIADHGGRTSRPQP